MSTACEKKKAIAVIPLRGGSISIRKKNIRPLLGRPLCHWILAAARDSGVFSEVWVATDDEEIAKVSEEVGAKVYWRSAESAVATAPTMLVYQEFLESLKSDYDLVCLAQATSPLVLPCHFREAVTRLYEQKADSCISVIRSHIFHWTEENGGPNGKSTVPVNHDPKTRPEPHQWQGKLFENGAFYIQTREAFERGAKWLASGDIMYYEMPGHTKYEIDEPDDWLVLEALAERYGYRPDQPREGDL